jgi:hypothetical protein
MKTTIEISDAIYRQVKARASLKGQTMKSFFIEALQEKLRRDLSKSDTESGWMEVFGKAPESSVEEVQAIIDEELSKIDVDGWQ